MSAWAESVFEFLFLYKPFVWQRGELVLAAGWPTLIAVAILALVAVPAVARYRQVRGKTRPLDRTVLAGLRVAALAVLLGCLLQPALVVATAVPQQNFVGLVLDDSRSMEIADVDGAARSEVIRGALGGPEAPLLNALEERFKVRSFRFAQDTGRLRDVEDMAWQGSRTDIARGLLRARQELASLPLSALVLISDGADNVGEALPEALESLRGARVPVFTVGVGRERFDRDVEIARVEAPRSALVGSAVVADVVVEQRGYAGRTVELWVEDEGRLVATRELELPAEGESARVRVHFDADEAGPRRLRFRLEALEGELVPQNNERESLLEVRDGAERILYVEGEPRWDVKFLRRAVEEDDNLRLGIFLRMAANNFARYGFESQEELYAGFPTSREELFRYKGLLLGSVEAEFFTSDQLQMIADFVGQRGGGMMMLGGRQAFGRGGWADTPVADVLPVLLEDAGAEPEFAEVRLEPTLVGRGHPATRIAADPEASLERWRELPPLITVNPLHRVKPGAATLLVGEGDELPEPQVALAFQRYGAGMAVAFPIFDSWQYQMHHEIPLEDRTHERLWQQLLRWLVSDAPGPVEVEPGERRFPPGVPLEVVARVRDDTFLAVNDARVEVAVTAPSGRETLLPLDWTVEADGRYAGRFTPQEIGVYRFEAVARRGNQELGGAVAHGEAARLDREFYGAEMDRELLRRIADETGGRFYEVGNIDELPGDLSFTDGGATVTEVLDVWNMPAAFLLLLGLIGGEWTWRKLRGLA